MSKPVLEVQDVHKSFYLPTEQASGLKQAFINWTKGIKGYKEQKVLDGVSFTVEQGDFFGIIGRNGSGKSTLLKIISQIYTPEAGSINVHGKLVPFIELGVGFNPELTGRENVYLNGALLGFSRSQVETMYDDIVEFAEIPEFMDQKLKNYSSGMQVRLAFSIAIKAHGDILVLDEVLAVGDEAFQRKCFDYFQQLKKEKKTVILVTHDMASAKKFCNKAIMIDDGKIVASGSPDEVANLYTMKNLERELEKTEMKKPKEEKDRPWIKLKLLSKSVLSHTDTVRIRVSYYSPKNIPLTFGISIIDEASNKITSVIDDGFFVDEKRYEITSRRAGVYEFDYELDLDVFNDRNFEITAALFRLNEKKRQFYPYAFIEKEDIIRFAVRNSQKHVDGGLLRLKGKWEK